MPIILTVAGVALIWSAVRDTQNALFTLLYNDVIGAGTTGFSKSFLAWIVAIVIIGSIGYIKTLRPISNAMLVLVIVVLFLANGGFFSKFTQQTGL